MLAEEGGNKGVEGGRGGSSIRGEQAGTKKGGYRGSAPACTASQEAQRVRCR